MTDSVVGYMSHSYPYPIRPRYLISMLTSKAKHEMPLYHTQPLHSKSILRTGPTTLIIPYCSIPSTGARDFPPLAFPLLRPPWPSWQG